MARGPSSLGSRTTQLIRADPRRSSRNDSRCIHNRRSEPTVDRSYQSPERRVKRKRRTLRGETMASLRRARARAIFLPPACARTASGGGGSSTTKRARNLAKRASAPPPTSVRVLTTELAIRRSSGIRCPHDGRIVRRRTSPGVRRTVTWITRSPVESRVERRIPGASSLLFLQRLVAHQTGEWRARPRPERR